MILCQRFDMSQAVKGWLLGWLAGRQGRLFKIAHRYTRTEPKQTDDDDDDGDNFDDDGRCGNVQIADAQRCKTKRERCRLDWLRGVPGGEREWGGGGAGLSDWNLWMGWLD